MYPPPPPVLPRAESRGRIQGRADMALPFTEPRGEGEIYCLRGGLGVAVISAHGP